MAKFEFFINDARIILSVMQNEAEWCYVFIESVDSVVRLGADTLERIKEKFIIELNCIPAQKTSIYRDVDVFLVTVLSEPHVIIYGSPVDDSGVELYLHDMNDNFYPVLRLTKQDIDRLIEWLEGIKI
jgi:hypothetical protein